MSNYKNHQNLIKKFKLEVYEQIPEIRVFDRHVGLFYNKKGTPIRINKPGMADCYALIPTKYGLIHAEYEFKTGCAKQTKEQKHWESFIRSLGGIYIIVREEYHLAIEETLEILNEKNLL